MRVWLVDDRDSAAGLEPLLRQLAERPGTGLRLLGASPFEADFAEAMRKLAADLLDLLVVNERAWPEGAATLDVLNLGLGVVVVTAGERLERFRELAEAYPIVLVPPAVTPEALWLALVAARAARQREAQWKNQITRLQQRLNDRIVIERAKGILVQRLKISEEDAYKRLRMLSRRQRRQIRDIAQALLDTQSLFTAEVNGFDRCFSEEPKPGAPSRSAGEQAGREVGGLPGLPSGGAASSTGSG